MKLPTNILELVIKWLFKHTWEHWETLEDWKRSDGKDMITSDYSALSHYRSLTPNFSGNLISINMWSVYHAAIISIQSYNKTELHIKKLHMECLFETSLYKYKSPQISGI